MNELITILGPTASGKTGLAAALAANIGAEIISADSRQVYRGMDIGTGKDLEDYVVGGKQIPYHLIDIADPGEEYNVYRFQEDFISAFSDISGRGKRAVLCGGTGLYLESVLLAYDLKEAPVNRELRDELAAKTTEDLIKRLGSGRELHNITDTSDRERLIRAIEISEAPSASLGTGSKQKSEADNSLMQLNHHVFGISMPRAEIRNRITIRLKQRLEEGMLEEIRTLLDQGVTAKQLEFYGLEYKFLTQHVIGEINYNDMFQRLNTAIHQFSKRQMTWFRRMEKRSVNINWIDGSKSVSEKLEAMEKVLKC